MIGKRERILNIGWGLGVCLFFLSTKQNVCVSGTRKSRVVRAGIRDDRIYCLLSQQSKDGLKLQVKGV